MIASGTGYEPTALIQINSPASAEHSVGPMPSLKGHPHHDLEAALARRLWQPQFFGAVLDKLP